MGSGSTTETRHLFVLYKQDITFFHCVEYCLRNEPPTSLQTDRQIFFLTFNSRKFVDKRNNGGEIAFSIDSALFS